jgi:hypothetical protein
MVYFVAGTQETGVGKYFGPDNTNCRPIDAGVTPPVLLFLQRCHNPFIFSPELRADGLLISGVSNKFDTIGTFCARILRSYSDLSSVATKDPFSLNYKYYCILPEFR